MIPTLLRPGEIKPGQFGPTRRAARPLSPLSTRSMSSVGIPSVMQTTTPTPRISRFQNGVGREGRRHENEGDVRARFSDRTRHGVEDRPALVNRAALAGRDAADDNRAVGGRLFGMEGPFPPGQALDEQPGVLVDENGHLETSG